VARVTNWTVAFLLGTVATPAGVVLAWLAPRPLDVVVAPPLVLVDIWSARSGTRATAATAPDDSAWGELLLLWLGLSLTWLFYVLVARIVLWRMAPPAPSGISSD
jgi:hypothetical protein